MMTTPSFSMTRTFSPSRQEPPKLLPSLLLPMTRPGAIVVWVCEPTDWLLVLPDSTVKEYLVSLWMLQLAKARGAMSSVAAAPITRARCRVRMIRILSVNGGGELAHRAPAFWRQASRSLAQARCEVYCSCRRRAPSGLRGRAAPSAEKPPSS